MKDLTDQRFGRLVVVRFVRKRYDGHMIWLCRCDCGVEKEVSRNRLCCSREPTRSCGCLQKDKARANRKHGYSGKSIRHVWVNIKQRCFNPRNPSYKNYGGRGITVCEEWSKDFSIFLKDMGDPPERGRKSKDLSIERINNDGPYCKENCYWATKTEQSLNRQKSVKITWRGQTKPLKTWCKDLGLNYHTAGARWKKTKDADYSLQKATPRKRRQITYNGQTKRLVDWAKEFNISRFTLADRLNHGWTEEEALTTPVKKYASA